HIGVVEAESLQYLQVPVAPAQAERRRRREPPSGLCTLDGNRRTTLQLAGTAGLPSGIDNVKRRVDRLLAFRIVQLQRHRPVAQLLRALWMNEVQHALWLIVIEIVF